jgi:hypothetical protein
MQVQVSASCPQAAVNSLLRSSPLFWVALEVAVLERKVLHCIQTSNPASSFNTLR